MIGNEGKGVTVGQERLAGSVMTGELSVNDRENRAGNKINTGSWVKS